MDALIFDTSAILNFGQRGQQLPLLTRFATVYRLVTTPEVASELSDPDRRDFNAALLRNHFTVQAPRGDSFDLATLSRIVASLGPGEVSVMLLAKQLDGTAVLDERAARRQSASLGLKITGTIGLLQDATTRGWINNDIAINVVRSLCAAGFSIRTPVPGESFPQYHDTFVRN